LPPKVARVFLHLPPRRDQRASRFWRGAGGESRPRSKVVLSRGGFKTVAERGTVPFYSGYLAKLGQSPGF